MNFQIFLNNAEREVNKKYYERIVNVLSTREERSITIDNQLNIIKFSSDNDLKNNIQELKNEIDKIDDEILIELREMIEDLVSEIVRALRGAGIYIKTKKDTEDYKKRGRVLGNKMICKIEELIDTTEDFTKNLYELVEELETSIVENKVTEVTQIIETNKDKYLKLHNKLSVVDFLHENGFVFERSGSNHDIYKNNKGFIIPVPRHNVERAGLYIQKEVNKINRAIG